MTKRIITIEALANELEQRLNNNKSIDCCKVELLALAKIAKNKIGDEMIEVNWKN